MQTLQKLSAIISEISKSHLSRSKRLGLVAVILTIAYLETRKVRSDSLSRFVFFLRKILALQIKICKPRSKLMQYIYLLSIAYVTKYLTRLEVFPYDLDKFMYLPITCSQSSRKYIDQNMTHAKARFIGIPLNFELSKKSNVVKHDIDSGEKEAWDTTESQIRIGRHQTQDF